MLPINALSVEACGRKPAQLNPAGDGPNPARAWWWLGGAGLAAVCCTVAAALAGSWVFAAAAALFLAYAIRVAILLIRDRSDRRRFGDAGDRAMSFVRAGDYSSVVQLGRSIMGNAGTTHYALWGLEWAAFGAIRAGDEIEMRHLLDEALQRGAESRIPAQLHAALGEHDSAIGYWEAAVVQPRGEAALPGLVCSLAVVGDTARAHRVIARAYESNPIPEMIEWRVWSLLEQNQIDAALEIVEAGAVSDPSSWGLTVFQVAAMLAGRHERSLDLGELALDGRPTDASIVATIRYNRACSFAQLGDIRAALAELRLVTVAEILAKASDDPDLAPVHATAEFRMIVDNVNRSP
jgi:tetratricopeptide (TPR) repeat protein